MYTNNNKTVVMGSFMTFCITVPY